MTFQLTRKARKDYPDGNWTMVFDLENQETGHIAIVEAHPIPMLGLELMLKHNQVDWRVMDAMLDGEFYYVGTGINVFDSIEIYPIPDPDIVAEQKYPIS